jgi:ABC-2 type transport system permease protein
MSGNSAFELVSERGWRRGLGNMLQSEMGHWWKTRRCWVNSLRWAGIIGLILSIFLFQTPGAPPTSEAVAALYAIIAGMIPAIAVIIMMQGAIVGEKENGTAAWVLSKPVTRPAFMLSKLIANSLGVLGTMVVPPGVVAYTLYAMVSGTPWNPIVFLEAMGVIFLFNFFFLSLTLMLGTFFNSRGPVIGISLGLLLGQQLLVGMLPSTGYVLPWNLILPTGEQMNAVVPCLLLGSNNYSAFSILFIALESIVFVLVGVYRFNREEY